VTRSPLSTVAALVRALPRSIVAFLSRTRRAHPTRASGGEPRETGVVEVVAAYMHAKYEAERTRRDAPPYGEWSMGDLRQHWDLFAGSYAEASAPVSMGFDGCLGVRVWSSEWLVALRADPNIFAECLPPIKEVIADGMRRAGLVVDGVTVVRVAFGVREDAEESAS